LLALKNTSTDFSLAKKTIQNTMAGLSSNRDVTTLIQTFSLYKSAADRDINSLRQYNTSIYGLYRYSALWPETAIKPLDQRKQGLSR
jgi:acyl-CoA-binding protein